MSFQFPQRTAGNGRESSKITGVPSAETFRDIGGNGSRGSANLGYEPKPFINRQT
jgi:hypothetical protein